MSRFYDKKLEALLPYVPGEQPKNMSELIKLNTNESPYPPSPEVFKVLDKEALQSLRLYPDPSCEGLVKALADSFSVDTSNVAVGNGSDELLAFCFHGLCQNGAAFADITYGFYQVYSQMFSVKTEIIPLRSDFSIAIEDYAKCDGTVFIANPNAPTGIALNRKDIEELLLQNKNRLIVVDEAYVDFGAESAIPLLEKYDNLLVVGTFSKSRQLAGARLGYAVGSKEIIEDINKMRFSFNPYNINRLSLAIGEAVIKDEKYFDYCRNLTIENRRYLIQKLRSMGFRVLPSKANFVFASSPEFSSGKEFYDELRKRNILVRHFDKERISKFVRITIGTTEQMDAFISATKDILNIEDFDCEY